jgi:hypothetical protein
MDKILQKNESLAIYDDEDLFKLLAHLCSYGQSG